MTVLIVLALSYVAMAAVSMSMSRHQGQVTGREMPPNASLAYRLGGWSLLAVALAPAVFAWGISVGILGWLGVLTFAALGLGLQFTYAPRSVMWSVPVAALVAGLAWLAIA